VRRGRLEVARLTWAGYELYDSLPLVELYVP
jgi:hypothetical protein